MLCDISIVCVVAYSFRRFARFNNNVAGVTGGAASVESYEFSTGDG